MKQLFKLLGIIALAAIMVFAVTGCREPNDSGTNPPGGETPQDNTTPGDTTTPGTGTPTPGPGPGPSVPNAGDLWSSDSGIAFSWIPAGTFTLGSEDANDWGASPSHSVTLSGFYIGRTEITQGQWKAVMGESDARLNQVNTSSTNYGRGDNYPMYYVSWYDILVFCNKLSVADGLTPAYSIDGETDPDEWGAVPTSSNATWNAVEIVTNSTGYRLPTEAQWEYACRAGTTTAYYTGDNIDDNLNAAAWYWNSIPTQTSTETGYGTQPVGTKTANAWNLYDMHGNVWEWCWDWYGAYTDSAKTDPVGASSGTYRVSRGGGWFSDAEIARSALRISDNPVYRTYDLGFRVARP